MKKEAINLKTSGDGHKGGFGKWKGEGEML